MKLFFILLSSYLLYLGTDHNQSSSTAQLNFQEDVKSIAFKVLTAKCNLCHATKKRTDIFTLENMDSLAPDIQKQVFVKKKMPKGRKVKLTEEESKALQGWLALTLNEKGMQ